MINKSAGVRNVFSSVHIERGRGFRSAELIHCSAERRANTLHGSHTYHANTHWCCTAVDHNLFWLACLVTFSLNASRIQWTRSFLER